MYLSKAMPNFRLSGAFRLILMMDMGNDDIFFVVENQTHNRCVLTFLKLQSIEKDKNEEWQFNMVNLGIQNSVREAAEYAPVTEFIVVMYKKDKQTSMGEDDFFMAAMARRRNHTLSFYCDFNMIEHFDCSDGSEVLDICTDNQRFFYQMAVPDQYDRHRINRIVKSCEISWRQRIGLTSSKIVKDASKLTFVLHQRIAPYFKLYSSFLSF